MNLHLISSYIPDVWKQIPSLATVSTGYPTIDSLLITSSQYHGLCMWSTMEICFSVTAPCCAYT